MLDDIKLSLEYAEKSEIILQRDMEHLAHKYIQERTDIELPMIEEDIPLPEVSFSTLLHRLKTKIIELKPDIHLDDQILHGYIDYYLDLQNLPH